MDKILSLPEIADIMRVAANTLIGADALDRELARHNHDTARSLYRAADELLPSVLATVDRAIDKANAKVAA